MFIGAKFVGGADKTLQMKDEGTLQEMLKAVDAL